MIGNAVQYASIPCLFSMTHAIAGERYQQTLSYILVTPAGRLPLFLGRALPVIANAMFVAAFSLLVSGFIIGIDVPVSAWPAIALIIVVSTFSCTGLGLICAGIGLRVRETAVLNNVIFGLLLIFTGANLRIDELPGWMQAISYRVPLTHGIEAARRVANGASLGDVRVFSPRGGDRRRLHDPRLPVAALHGAGEPEAGFARGRMTHALRLFWTGWLFNVKNLTMSGFFMLNAAILPVFYATIAYYMFSAGARPGSSLLYASLGAGMMGIWSSTLFGSGGLIQWQRWQGTLEYVIGVPTPLILVVLPMTIATASIGLYSVGATLAWGWLIFDLPLHFAHPVWFAVALPAAVLSLGLLGLVLASTFVLLRNANSLSNLLEYPVWLVTGLLVGALPPPRLDAPDLVGARADLGDSRDATGCDRR